MSHAQTLKFAINLAAPTARELAVATAKGFGSGLAIAAGVGSFFVGLQTGKIIYVNAANLLDRLPGGSSVRLRATPPGGSRRWYTKPAPVAPAASAGPTIDAAAEAAT